MEISDQRNKNIFFKIMVAEHVAFIQLDKCDWDGQLVINNWILLKMPVSYESNQSG